MKDGLTDFCYPTMHLLKIQHTTPTTDSDNIKKAYKVLPKDPLSFLLVGQSASMLWDLWRKPKGFLQKGFSSFFISNFLF